MHKMANEYYKFNPLVQIIPAFLYMYIHVTPFIVIKDKTRRMSQ